MSEMQFMSSLRAFLNREGSIYTVRRFKYRTTNVYVEGVGRCKRRLIRYVSDKEELSDYVILSGFGTLNDWWMTIRRFIPPGEDMYLFKVVVTK